MAVSPPSFLAPGGTHIAGDHGALSVLVGVHCRHEGATPASRPQGPEVGIFNPSGLGLEGPDTHVTLRAIAACSDSAGPALKWPL